MPDLGRLALKKHIIRLTGGSGEELRVPAATLVETVSALLDGAQKSVRLFAEGESVAKGRKPTWLERSCDVQITGLQAGSAAISVEAPVLSEAVPERFGDSGQQELFDEEDGCVDPTFSAIDCFGKVLSEALKGDKETIVADRAMLKSCIRFTRSTGGPFEGIRLEGVAGFSGSDTLSADDASVIERLHDETPESEVLRSTGVLDTISATKPGILLRFDDGSSIKARIEDHDPERLRDLFGKRVIVSGVVHYMPSGRPRLIDVEYIDQATDGSEVWQGMPTGMKPADAPIFTPRTQDESSGVSAIFGSWPGDETEEELLTALDEIG